MDPGERGVMPRFGLGSFWLIAPLAINEGEVTGSLILARVRRVLLLAGLVAMGMLVAGTSAQAAGPPPPVLAWSYDFGTVDGVGGKTATQTLTLPNPGGSSTGTPTRSR
jgi:hypothetical protein